MDLSIEKTQDFSLLTLPQKIAFKGVMNGGFALILGGGGVGKSHLIGAMKRHLPNFVAVGTSGVASVNIDSITLDSYLGLRPGVGGLIDFADLSDEHKQAIRKVRTLLIDEASFLRIDKFERVDHRLRTITGIDQPFGGIQIVLVGDFCQLPPVIGKYDEQSFRQRYGSRLYCFESPLYQAAGFTPYVLDNYVRQGDPEEQAILKRIRVHSNIPLCIKKMQPRLSKKPFETGVSLYPNNKLVETENNRKAQSVSGRSTTYTAEYEGEIPREEKTLPHSIELKPGFRIMTTVNKPDSGYVNGDLGTIRRCLKDRIVVEMDRGAEVTVDPTLREITEQVWEGEKMENRVIASMRQLPVKIAYALTIHKSQGLTLDNVNLTLDRNGYFPFLGYVGTSRTRKLGDIHIRHPLTPRCFSINPVAVDFTLSQSRIAMARRDQDVTQFSLSV